MANTNKGRKVYICTTPQPSNLNQSQFAALTYVEVSNVGAVGESGTNTNIVSYDELATEVTQKQKGISNAGDPTVECARNPTDPGQIAMRAAGKSKLLYAVKFEDSDAPDANSTNTVYYNRGLVTGPTRPNGRNEDFILEVFTLGLVQPEIVVDPASLVAPANSLKPSIAGVLTQGEILTALPGVWSGNPAFAYQWKRDGANISGATGSTYTLVAGDAAKAISIAVTGTNGAGNATATSAATANVT